MAPPLERGSDADGSEAVTEILSDVVAEGRRILDLAAERGVSVALLGGVAIRLRAEVVPAPFARDYQDLDFVVDKGTWRDAEGLLRDAGYEANVAFNTMHARERMLFLDGTHGRQVDVFVGGFRMCHEIPLDGRVEIDADTLPLADLLLTKLQIVELNEKDVTDALLLLHGHDVSDTDAGAINGSRVAQLCARDWGLWRTLTAHLAALAAHSTRYGLPVGERDRIVARAQALQERIDATPKSKGWRVRARIGERKRWYDLPEEVA